MPNHFFAHETHFQYSIGVPVIHKHHFWFTSQELIDLVQTNMQWQWLAHDFQNNFMKTFRNATLTAQESQNSMNCLQIVKSSLKTFLTLTPETVMLALPCTGTQNRMLWRCRKQATSSGLCATGQRETKVFFVPDKVTRVRFYFVAIWLLSLFVIYWFQVSVHGACIFYL